MLAWSIAAAQFAPQNGSLAENIVHHLRFIHAAAKLECKVLIFPELSLTGLTGESGLPHLLAMNNYSHFQMRLTSIR
ncbi:nitrilase-related carbon-nitrogen hydrolase [Pseudocitrobacter faecalis]